VSVNNRLAFPIRLLLTAFERGLAGVVRAASASVDTVGGCKGRVPQMTCERPAANHDPSAEAAPPPREIADVIELAGKRKHER
jgi:hypothetical protein